MQTQMLVVKGQSIKKEKQQTTNMKSTGRGKSGQFKANTRRANTILEIKQQTRIDHLQESRAQLSYPSKSQKVESRKGYGFLRLGPKKKLKRPQETNSRPQIVTSNKAIPITQMKSAYPITEMNSTFSSRELIRNQLQAFPEKIHKKKGSPATNQIQKNKRLSECPVCATEIIGSELQIFAVCGHKFCRRCLSQHIQASLQDFKVARCLSDGCSAVLQFQSPHIQALSAPQRQKYYNAAVFANMEAHPQLRLCPREDCDGFINTQEKVAKCAMCKTAFCKKCLMPQHQRQCDENGAHFLQENYKFKRCRCGIILERNQGCNHMTCRCGYQFCYNCGSKWQSSHYQCNQAQRVQAQRVQAQRVSGPPEIPACQRYKQNTLKFLKLLVLFLAFCLADLIWLLILLASVLIFLLISIIFQSLWKGLQIMIKDYTCLQKVAGNIFLYVYCVACVACQVRQQLVRNIYWQGLCSRRMLLPITSMLKETMYE